MMRTQVVTAKKRRSGLNLPRRIDKEGPADTAWDGKRHGLLKRYLSEARGRRKKAFQAWIEHMNTAPTDKREAA